MMRHRIVLGALLLAAGAPACKGKNADAQPLPPPTGSALPAPDVPKLDTLMQGDAPSAATTEAAGAYMATGTLRAREEADLGPKVTGVLTQLTVEEGSKVKKGQLLFRVDAGHAALAVQQAQAALQAAEVSQAAAALDFQRTKELLDRNSVAPATFDQAKSRLEAAQAAVDQAKAAVSLARKTAGDTAVFSPIDGVVTAKLKSVGESVSVTPPTVVLSVQNTAELEIRVRFPEGVLKTVKPGSELDVSIAALGVSLKVPVARINPGVDPRSRTVELVAFVDNAEGKLRPGMLVMVSLAKEVAAPAKDEDTSPARAAIPPKDKNRAAQ